MNRYDYFVFLADDEAARQLAGSDQAFQAVRVDFESALRERVCQISGATDAARGGGGFDFLIRFRVNGVSEAIVPPRGASVFIRTCEAP